MNKERALAYLLSLLPCIGAQPQRDMRRLYRLPTTPTGPLPTNLMLMVFVSRGGGEVYSSTSTSSPGHGNFGGSSIPLHTTRRSSLIPSALDDPPVVTMVDEESVE